jgi:hypothetical protein
MDSTFDPEQRQAFASFLSALAFSMFGVFAVTAVASALPLQVLSPDWQMRISASLIDNGPIAALGLLAAWLAAMFASSPVRDQARLDTVRQWAIAAALGYLLLIPLQASAAWRGLSQVLASERQEQKVMTAQLSGLREVVRNAPSAAALQQQWGERQGPQLNAAHLAQPLPQLREQLLNQLQQLENRWQAPARATAQRARVWGVVQNTLRLCCSALFLAIGFAAAAKGRGNDLTMLQSWQLAWVRCRKRLRPRDNLKHRSHNEDAEYFDAISPKD